jgi:hypothetical protein
MRARDPWAAVEAVVDTVGQLSSGAALGTNEYFKPARSVWVEFRASESASKFTRCTGKTNSIARRGQHCQMLLFT